MKSEGLQQPAEDFPDIESTLNVGASSAPPVVGLPVDGVLYTRIILVRQNGS